MTKLKENLGITALMPDTVSEYFSNRGYYSYDLEDMFNSRLFPRSFVEVYLESPIN